VKRAEPNTGYTWANEVQHPKAPHKIMNDVKNFVISDLAESIVLPALRK
jgi:hypothetical protein